MQEENVKINKEERGNYLKNSESKDQGKINNETDAQDQVH